MNLTINHNHRNNPPVHSHNQKQRKMEVQMQKESPRDAERQCSTFFYSCMAGKRSSPRLEEIAQERHPRIPMQPCSPPESSLLQNSQQLPRRRKISLSLNLKHSRHRTPSKDEANSHHRPASQHKKFKTEQGTPQQQPSKGSKLKTQPKKQTQGKEYTHQLKQSRKPSTQIGSAHSAKKSNDSSNKMKLTLSNAFKSQMNHAPQAPPFMGAPIQEPPPSSLMIEDSFMTARLANIYAGSELQLFPNSNIVYYNQIMANDWRGHQQKRQRPKGEISIQDIQQLPAQDPPSDPNIQSKFKERKWIGDYAKTIKTFNQSELRSNDLNSDAQSIVLEKGCSQFNAFVPVSHGSSKQCKEQPKSKEITRSRRGYGSVGEQYGAFSATNQSKFKKLASPPIVEDLYDSEHYE